MFTSADASTHIDTCAVHWSIRQMTGKNPFSSLLLLLLLFVEFSDPSGSYRCFVVVFLLVSIFIRPHSHASSFSVLLFLVGSKAARARECGKGAERERSQDSYKLVTLFFFSVWTTSLPVITSTALQGNVKDAQKNSAPISTTYQWHQRRRHRRKFSFRLLNKSSRCSLVSYLFNHVWQKSQSEWCMWKTSEEREKTMFEQIDRHRLRMLFVYQ